MSPKIEPSGFTNETYDRLFKAIFGRENQQSKQWRLELYNALRGTNYKDPDALEINTIENVIYLTMRNDISFLVDSQMTLFEYAENRKSVKNNCTRVQLFRIIKKMARCETCEHRYF